MPLGPREYETIRLRNSLLIGLGIRESLSFWTGHPFDFEIWVRLGYYVSKGFDPYRTTGPIASLSIPGTGLLPSIGYPPLWAFMQAVVYDFYSALGIDSRFLYYFLIKQETVIGDVAVAYLIFLLVKRWASVSDAQRACAFWMFCPFTIIISSVWGMFDQLVLVFVLFALLSLNHSSRSSLSEGVGILLKGIPIIFLPALAWGQHSRVKRVGYVLLALGLAAVAALVPYLVYSDWKISALLATGTDVVNKVSNSMNYWVIPYVLSANSLLPAGAAAALSAAGYVWVGAILLAYAFCFWGVKPKDITDRYLIPVLSFATLVFFLTRGSINEQYATYFIAFGLLERYSLGHLRSRLFNGVWVSALGFLLVNNAYMTRFFSPLSIDFTHLNDMLVSGFLGDIRYGLLISLGLSFTAFCAFYLKSLFSELRTIKAQGFPVFGESRGVKELTESHRDC
ncbi:MAG: hypothetical protein OK422_04640 [Thaumarchaeota archaeon]|nr:hypothetical protein [Nitrososphaerota archaeon]